MKKISITQKDNFGCGIACVGFILGISYKKTLNLLSEKEQAMLKKGFTCKGLVKILNRNNKNFFYKYLNNKTKTKIYKDFTTVFIKRSKKYPVGHYLCRYNKYWMDSWINWRECTDIDKAESGFRKRLPGRPIYGIFESMGSNIVP